MVSVSLLNIVALPFIQKEITSLMMRKLGRSINAFRAHARFADVLPVPHALDVAHTAIIQPILSTVDVEEADLRGNTALHFLSRGDRVQFRRLEISRDEPRAGIASQRRRRQFPE
jgi:hypothetical protein